MLALKRGYSIFPKKFTPVLSSINTRNYHLTSPNYSLYTKEKSQDNQDNTIKDIVDNDYGLYKFVSKSYTYTLGSITIFLMGGTVMAMTLPSDVLIPTAIVGVIGSIISAIPLTIIKSKIIYTNKIVNGNKITYPILKNDVQRNLAYGGIVLGITMTSSPVLQNVLISDPLSIVMATGCVLGIMGGSTYYASSLKSGKLNYLGPPLMGGLCGLVGMNLIGIGFSWYGNYDVSNVIRHIDLYGGTSSIYSIPSI